MSNGNFPNLGALDDFARDLFRHAKSAGPEFADIAIAVRRLHGVLKHLKVEAEDPDSLLNSHDAAVYNRQLAPLVEDCDFNLQQLETILKKYGDVDRLEERERDMINMIRTKLANQKTSIDMFLDTIQLQNPTKAQRIVNEQGGNLDNIKDKVDAIAARLFARRHSGVGDDDEDLWQQFRTELEREGFSKEVLRKNKEVLRAYIRELEESTGNDATAPPSVRGLLAQERGETYGSYNDRRKAVPAVDPRTSVPNLPAQYSSLSTYDREDEMDDHNDSLALISTRDLMALDNLNTGMENLRIAAAPLQNYSISPSDASPSTRYLPPEVASNLGVSPRFVPPMSRGGLPFGASPRTSASRLAPDARGKDIPLEAQWTRIRRALVSPEVLERAGVRYEARPDYVAVLGVLTREEITNFARLSAEARSARSRGRRPPPPNNSNNSPPTPRSRRRADSRGFTSSSDDILWDSSDATSSDSGYDHKKESKQAYYIVPPPSDKEKGTSPSATVQPKPILKNKNENHVRFDPEPHELEPTPPRSYREERDKSRHRSSRRDHRDGGHDRDRGDRERNRDRERDYRDRDHREHREHREHRDRDRDHYPRRHHRDRTAERERRDKKKAWGETLGAVGIGGAAASLLSVLTEAASVL
ncbi:hypothetical protein CGCS363_v001935 [Colletotrichum siamense]|uniref:uncharacterized protein n=1 Tax=Colletotrichum siamense TaxID=690259 RepID=UPI00187293DA|nr:uncharacterized protein CGCS363_v001935 [Colletotrichum siamense]KAF5516115.1 hypothetical protein CGCS363_v001935 [Colletotrichum siamense]